MSNIFGTYIQSSRKKQKLSVYSLADTIGVDFTYISKIEGGHTPPPSERIIGLLAKTLQEDEKYLLRLAGKIPHSLKYQMRESPELTELIWMLCESDPSEDTCRNIILLLTSS